MFFTDKSPLPHPNLISPAFPSVFLRLLVSENSAAVKEEKLSLKTYMPSVFRPRAFFFTRTQYFFLTVVCSLSPRPLSLSLDCFRLFRFFSSRRKTFGFKKTFLKSHMACDFIVYNIGKNLRRFYFLMKKQPSIPEQPYQIRRPKKAGKTLLLFSFFEKTFGTLRPIPAGRNQKV